MRRMTLQRRLCNLYDEIAWQWDRHKTGLMYGFILGVFAGTIAAEFAASFN